MPEIVDNLTEAEEKRGKLIEQIQQLYNQGVKVSEIARRTGKNRKTISKYIEGETEKLCRSNSRAGSLDAYTGFIISELQNEVYQAEIVRKLKEKGYAGSAGNARSYIKKLCNEYGITASRYTSGGNSTGTRNGSGSSGKAIDYITRKGIFNHLWMDINLTDYHKRYVYEQYPVLYQFEKCINEFRYIFENKNMVRLYLFADEYSKSNIKELVSFANGLIKDINAVENAVASDLSNGFVEGTNSKVKMVKRTMYGRCNTKLLAAKLMYTPVVASG